MAKQEYLSSTQNDFKSEKYICISHNLICQKQQVKVTSSVLLKLEFEFQNRLNILFKLNRFPCAIAGRWQLLSVYIYKYRMLCLRSLNVHTLMLVEASIISQCSASP